jgi:uncharacterized protein YabE (DUF348 family)
VTFSSPSIQPSRVIIAMIAALGLLLGLAAVVSATSWDKRVTLDVDGRLVTHRTTATSVDGFLAETGVKPAANDQLSVASESLSDGDTVTIRTAKPLTLMVDGRSSIVTSHALTVSEALQAQGVAVQPGAWLSDELDSSLSREGNLVVVSNPKNITLKVDGAKTKVTSNAPTVEAFLSEAGVELGKLDEVSKATWKYLKPNAGVRVTRVERVMRTREIPTRFATEVQKDTSKYTTDREVVQPGKKGLDSAEVLIVKADGKVRERTIVSRSTIREPITQIEKRGTQNPNNVDGGVWDRLAACEAGGNWQINTGNGYYGGLQFSASSWRAVGGSGLPHQNSKVEQIKRGKILQARGGWGNWPGCSSRLGLR